MDIATNNLDDLSAKAQTKSQFPTANVFMLTQYDDPDLRLNAEKTGAAGYSLKDDLSQLQRLIVAPEGGAAGPEIRNPKSESPGGRPTNSNR